MAFALALQLPCCRALLFHTQADIVTTTRSPSQHDELHARHSLAGGVTRAAAFSDSSHSTSLICSLVPVVASPPAARRVVPLALAVPPVVSALQLLLVLGGIWACFFRVDI